MPLNAAMRSRLEELKDLYSSQGKRCLLLARKVINAGGVPNDTESQAYEKAIVDESKSGLVLVGFVAIVDPLRVDIPHVVSTLRGAGIRIAMVSDF
jgi:sodium/potassium-transporting ATPase subunit alpha